ncbi:unnamed protein product, partial [Vitis vinifera]|uniref:Uncharacterized protein n=1 Tax=Vitis vinifera TaxID=29760 RepID=D7TIN7_VITVI
MILTIYTNYLIYLSVYLINIFKEKILKVYFSLGIENNLLLFWLELLWVQLAVSIQLMSWDSSNYHFEDLGNLYPGIQRASKLYEDWR